MCLIHPIHWADAVTAAVMDMPVAVTQIQEHVSAANTTHRETVVRDVLMVTMAMQLLALLGIVGNVLVL